MDISKYLKTLEYKNKYGQLSMKRYIHLVEKLVEWGSNK